MMMTYHASPDKQYNRQEATAPEETEKVNIVRMGMERLQQLVKQPLERYASGEIGDESAMAATSDSESSADRVMYRGRKHIKEEKERK